MSAWLAALDTRSRSLRALVQRRLSSVRNFLCKLSKEKITQRLRMRRKQLAVCKAKSDGLERHLQDKMVMKTKLESTERVLTEWKKTGKALQTQVHRLTMQRNAELLKQQRLSMQISAAHKQLAEAGIKVNGLTNEQKALLAKKMPFRKLKMPSRRRTRLSLPRRINISRFAA